MVWVGGWMDGLLTRLCPSVTFPRRVSWFKIRLLSVSPSPLLFGSPTLLLGLLIDSRILSIFGGGGLFGGYRRPRT